MKSWRKWTLVVLLVWLLLFLLLLGHILDPRSPSVPQTRSSDSGLIRTEARHLTSVIQRGNRTPSWSLSPAGLSEDWRKMKTDFWFRSWDYYRKQSLELLQGLWSGNLSNKHRVDSRGPTGAHRSSPQLYCDLKWRTTIRTLDGTEKPFSSLGWDRLVPSLSLQELQTSHYESCAVVTSAGALLNSSLRLEIGKTPHRGFERDVGNKTTIRIINSQIVARPKHRFSSSSLYQDVTLLVWDPAPYSANLTQWFKTPDFDLFSPYVERRRIRPEQPFYILHPQFIWSLWDLIRDNTEEPIQPNPPHQASLVSVYEFIPSLRHTDLSHYHECYHDAACTLGAYHPLLYEKLLIQRVNRGEKDELKMKGKVRLRGLSSVHCQT
uniref:Beta-galactoside alpha-2,6-sialyltransferase 1 n=1 Tax=Echeneis naucrates TaxID=173247 RepID=A0A665U3U8_ECHNA